MKWKKGVVATALLATTALAFGQAPSIAFEKYTLPMA